MHEGSCLEDIKWPRFTIMAFTKITLARFFCEKEKSEAKLSSKAGIFLQSEKEEKEKKLFPILFFLEVED